MSSKLIVALDFDNQQEALSLVDMLEPTSCALKVGSELFTLLGAQFVRQLIARQFKVFLDLKFHDIPNTVARACSVAADMGVWMMNVHALGGLRMMQTAKKSLESYGKDSPILIAVTILTSFNEHELTSVGINHPLVDQVKKLAKLAYDAGLDGVVSSAHEVKMIKQECGSGFVTVTPGIRLDSDSNDDQTRIMTPQQAINEGSNFIVVGRPITRAENPALVVEELLNEIG